MCSSCPVGVLLLLDVLNDFDIDPPLRHCRAAH